MAEFPSDGIFTIAEAILAAVVAEFAGTPGVEPLPGRQLVSEGLVAIDCDQLVVEHVRSYPGTPGNEGARLARCGAGRVATFRVWLVRCAAPMQPDGSPPSAEALSASAHVLLRDAWVLQRGMAGRAADGEIASRPCEDVLVRDLVPYGPDGGFVGNQLLVDVSLGGAA